MKPRPEPIFVLTHFAPSVAVHSAAAASSLRAPSPPCLRAEDLVSPSRPWTGLGSRKPRHGTYRAEPPSFDAWQHRRVRSLRNG